MCQLFESIRIQDGAPCNLDAHQGRVDRARREVLGLGDSLDLRTAIVVPPQHAAGRVKCRVVYGAEIESVSFERYARREVRSLRLVRADDISYNNKFCDRDRIGALLRERGDCDDILIVKNGRVTDTSFSNIVFFDGSGWITPDAPLLAGTMRERLVREGLVLEGEVRPGDLRLFSRACLVNAMLDMGESVINLDRIAW